MSQKTVCDQCNVVLAGERMNSYRLSDFYDNGFGPVVPRDFDFCSVVCLGAYVQTLLNLVGGNSF